MFSDDRSEAFVKALLGPLGLFGHLSLFSAGLHISICSAFPCCKSCYTGRKLVDQFFSESLALPSVPLPLVVMNPLNSILQTSKVPLSSHKQLAFDILNSRF